MCSRKRSGSWDLDWKLRFGGFFSLPPSNSLVCYSFQHCGLLEVLLVPLLLMYLSQHLIRFRRPQGLPLAAVTLWAQVSGEDEDCNLACPSARLRLRGHLQHLQLIFRVLLPSVLRLCQWILERRWRILCRGLIAFNFLTLVIDIIYLVGSRQIRLQECQAAVYAGVTQLDTVAVITLALDGFQDGVLSELSSFHTVLGSKQRFLVHTGLAEQVAHLRTISATASLRSLDSCKSGDVVFDALSFLDVVEHLFNLGVLRDELSPIRIQSLLNGRGHKVVVVSHLPHQIRI
mmetsp:Transcript_11261/g.18117  ORF Transcript_11261/g.18117 Transcript_11261/m.18117 type:complete len:289 (+) Transcript_11261:2198-3064(+)